MREIGVALIGTKFMGKAHANAYRQVRAFFAPEVLPKLTMACGTEPKTTRDFAFRFGFARYTTNWEEAVAAGDVDLVDICAPNDLHFPLAEAAAKHGKAVFCEKPLARNLEEAKAMLKAVAEAGVPHMICFNYRFFPAIQLAKKLISEGALGEIRQFHALYLQDWGLAPGLPLTWRFQKERAGSGALGDTAVHIVDLARFLVGEIAEVTGMLTTFIPERPLPDGSGMGKVTVDDTAAFLARFQSGATGVFETSRIALGRKNFMHIEINGSRGSIFWNAEDPNWALALFPRRSSRHSRFPKNHGHGGGSSLRAKLVAHRPHPRLRTHLCPRRFGVLRGPGRRPESNARFSRWGQSPGRIGGGSCFRKKPALGESAELKMGKKAQIVRPKEADILNSPAQHSHALNP